MVKVIGSRIYLECKIGNLYTYINEMSIITRLGLDKHVIIWDQSRQEEKIADIDTYDIFLSMNKTDEFGRKIFDRRIWINLINNYLHRTKYLHIGCWKSEINVIDEIKSNCKILDIEDYGKQIKFFTELNGATSEYINNRHLNSDGNIKWFNLSLYSSNSERSLILTSSHFGEENYIFELDAGEVEKTITIVENNDIYVRISRHQLFTDEHQCNCTQ